MAVSKDFEAFVAAGVRNAKTIGSPAYPWDEAALRERAVSEYRRAFNPAGVARQRAAIGADGDRTEDLKKLRVPAVVLHGAGESFCAGLDLIELQQRSAPEGLAHSLMWHRAFERIQFGAVPVVSVLHGAVVGGGLELAAATHIRVAERSAFFALPEGQRGVFLGGGGAMRLPRLIGAARVMDMMLTGRTLTAEEGQAAGATQYLVDDGKGLETAMALAAKAASNTSTTNFAVMHALPRIAESNPASGLLTESLMASIAEMSGEAKQRLRDFLEKRAAKVTRQS